MLSNLNAIRKGAFIALIGLAVSCQNQGKIEVLKIAHVLDGQHPVHQAIEQLGEQLAILSNGQMRLDIYPGAQMGSEREYIESLQIGSLDMTKVNSGVLENFVPELAVLSLPYIFESAEHRWKVYQGPIGKSLLDKGDQYWLKGLCFFETGSRNFYLKEKRVTSPQDLTGLKIRTMRSYWSMQTINALGGSATPIAFGELYTALQQGVVDAAENNIPTLFQSRHYEVCKYVILDGHSAPSDVLLISTNTWKRLTPEQRGWLEQAVASSLNYQKQLWEEATDHAINEMESMGIEVIRPDLEPFRKKVEPLFEKMKEDDDPLYPIYREIKNAADGTLSSKPSMQKKELNETDS